MIKKRLGRVKRRFILNFLEKSDPDKIARIGEDKVVPAFLRAAEGVPAYQKILAEKKVDISKIRDLDDFKEKVPVVVKGDVFGRFDAAELCVGGEFPEDAVSVFTSSGFSKKFSYGIVTERDGKKVREMLAFILGYEFDANNKKTLLINSEAMGVTFSSPYPMVNTSVRSDMVLTLLKVLKKEFEQFIILADPHFAKKIVEDGIDSGFDWKAAKVSFVLGGDWISNSLVKYLMEKTEMSFENPEKKIRLTMGLSELGLNLFHDGVNLARVRDAAQGDEKLKKALFGDLGACSELMYYYPQRTFMEVINRDKNGFGELVFSMLDKDLKMPLTRYNSKDAGKLFGFNEFSEILKKHGYGNLIPEFHLPIVAVSGRGGDDVVVGGAVVGVDDLKEVFYRDFSVANSITGYFRVVKKPKLLVEIQLKEGVKLDRMLVRKIQKNLFDLTHVSIPIKFYKYGDFPYGMGLDYEGKFKFI